MDLFLSFSYRSVSLLQVVSPHSNIAPAGPATLCLSYTATTMPPSLSLSLSLSLFIYLFIFFKLQRNYISGRNACFSQNDRNSPKRPIQIGIVRYLKRNKIRVYWYQIFHQYEKLLLYWPVWNGINFLGRNADTSRILECNRIVGLPLPERKIPTRIEWYLKHWSCTVFEEIYEIRRKMMKRERGLFWFFFFFRRNFWFEFVLMFIVLV